MNFTQLSSEITSVALEHCSSHVCVIDQHADIIYVNKSWWEFGKHNGANQSSWLGVNYLEACETSAKEGDEYSLVVKQAIEALLHDPGNEFQIEYPCHAPWEKRWFLLRVKSIQVGEQLCLCLYHDLMPGDRDLEMSQKRLALAVESASLGVWEYDIEQEKLDWNAWMYVIHGLNPGTFQPSLDRWLGRIHPEDRWTISNAVNACIENKSTINIECRVVTPTGSIRYIIMKAQLFNNEDRGRRIIGVNVDATDKTHSEEKIRHLAFYDQLTDLPNREMLAQRLREAVSSAARTGKFHAVLFLDLDDFKRVNDSAGHSTGDRLLIEASGRLKSITRDCDFIARLGGDEFVILLTGLGDTEYEASSITLKICDKIVVALGRSYIIEDKEYVCSASIGVTLFNDSRRCELELLSDADLAMYQAKGENKGSIGFYNTAMKQALSESLDLERELRTAIMTDQLSIVFQPQITDGEGIIGAEALVRWKHPKRGYISPSEFIKAAENSTLISLLNDWILERACRQIAALQHHDSNCPTKFAINISAKQLEHEGFVSKIRSTLKNYDIDPATICLEVTEGAILRDFDKNIPKIAELKSIGVSFSVDDFGTGYSSLAYVQRLPVNQLKIDKSFVDDLLKDGAAVSITKAIIALANSLEINVIAEGVESEEQRNVLRSLGCKTFQGYFYSKPVPISDYGDLSAKCRNSNNCEPSCQSCPARSDADEKRLGPQKKPA